MRTMGNTPRHLQNAQPKIFRKKSYKKLDNLVKADYCPPMTPNELLDPVDLNVEYLIPPLETTPPESMKIVDTREKIHAAAMTACALLALGDDEIPEEEVADGRDLARIIFRDGREPTEEELKRPAVVLHLEALLGEYDYEILRDATQVRQYVTNRLLEESGPDKDPKQSLRALQMLGNITEVGLFTERVEVTVKQQTTEELEDKLKQALDIINARTVEGEVVRVGGEEQHDG